MKAHKSLLILLMILLPLSLFAQEEATPETEEEKPSFGFNMELGLGTTTIDDPESGEAETWNNLMLMPEFTFGKFGIGLALDINFAFTDDEGNSGFQVREEDWVPGEEYNFWELYLPIFRYIRYGQKGEALYAKIGSIDDFRLGNGFIISNYANTRFLPEQRIAGLSFDLDASLFDFPYIGIETAVGNLAKWDVIGGRIYTRPIYWTDVPVIKELQLGFTAVADNVPFYFHGKKPEEEQVYASLEDQVEPVVVWGFDLRLPILNNDNINLAAFTDLVNQNNNLGYMIGFGGKLVNFVTYGAQLRFLGENFQPTYFDMSYDLFRMEKWLVYSGEVELDAYNGWMANLGIDALEGKIVFSTMLEGSFTPDTDKQATLPTLTGALHLDKGLLGGFSFNALYQKKYIEDIADLVSPYNAFIQATIGYTVGPATISMVYDLKYDPNASGDNWEVKSKLETSISLTQ